MGFSPRKRALRKFGTIQAWPENTDSDVRVLGFAGWKAGMTHVLMRDTNPNSTSAGQEIRKAVTVVEAPPMKVLAVRGYRMTPYGMQTAGEVWADLSESSPDGLMPRLANQTRGERDAEQGRKPAKRGGRIPTRAGSAEGALESLKEEDLCEVRLIVATQPSMVKSIPGKTPEIMEVSLTGNDNTTKLDWASERLGGEIDVSDVWQAGQDVDVVGVTKGKGWQGAVKRWGVKILSHKNSKRRRQAGCLLYTSPSPRDNR